MASASDDPGRVAGTVLGSELDHALSDAIDGARGVEEKLRALLHLSPRKAARWLLEEERTARDSLSEDALRRIIDVLIDALGDDDGGTGERRDRPRSHVELLTPYADLVSANALAAALERGPAEPDAALDALIDEVLRRDPHHARLLDHLGRREMERGNHQEAHRLLTRLGRAEPKQSTVHRIWRARRTLPPTEGAPVRIGLLSSFTIDPLAPFLDLECRELGLEPEIYVAPFDHWLQECLAERSGLRDADPEIVFLAVSLDDLVPGLAGGLDAEEAERAGDSAVERTLTAVHGLTDWFDGIVVVHGFHSVHVDPAGVARGEGPVTDSGWIDSLNLRLRDELGELPRARFLDLAGVLVRRGGGVLDNPKMRHLARMRLFEEGLAAVARAHARYLAPLKGLTRKCVMVDLDNTLWGGVVGEVGPHGIKLGETSPGSEYRELQHFLRSLTRRGFLLAVNSKNNPDDALAAIRSHDAMVLGEDDFSAMRINWRPKPENARSIAEELNIGLDSLVFVDDNPHEREMMRQMCGEVLTPELPEDPSRFRAILADLPQLQKLTVTETDRGRVQMYRARRKREARRERAASLDEYLHSLELRVEVGPLTEASLTRVHQMVSRTNQFNLTTRRYGEGELAGIAGDPEWRTYVLRAADRFGDHGIVAAALARLSDDEWRIDTLLMSCRVIGYGVETALLSCVLRDAAEAGSPAVVGELVETEKNVPARGIYADLGFTEVEGGGDDGVRRWRADPAETEVESPSWIRVERERAG